MKVGDTFWQVEKSVVGIYYCYPRTIKTLIDLEFFVETEGAQSFTNQEKAEKKVEFYNNFFKK